MDILGIPDSLCHCTAQTGAQPIGDHEAATMNLRLKKCSDTARRHALMKSLGMPEDDLLRR